MQVTLDDLVPIAVLEQREAELAEQIRHGERRITTAQRAVDEATTAFARLDDELAALAREQHRLEDELRRAESLRDAARDALARGLGDAAAERQIERSSALADEAETRILEILERRDALATERAVAARRREEATAELSTVTAREAPALERARAELAETTREREAAVAALPRDVATQYAALRARLGTALAAVAADKTCSACSRVVPSQRLGDVRAGRLVTCDGCGRWLYVPRP